jgi:hypothetical protein
MTQNNENICNFLVFGLIAPIGCSKIKFFKFMNDNLIQEEFNFNFENIIKISENYLKDFIDQNSNKDKKIQLIDIGNKLRETTKNYAILAIKAITEIIKILRLNNVIAHIFLHAIISRVRVIIAFFIRLKACYSMPTYCT